MRNGRTGCCSIAGARRRRALIMPLLPSGAPSPQSSRRLRPAVLSATTGFAYDRITTARLLAGIGTAQEDHDGQEVSAAAQASLPLEFSGVRVTPRAGVQFVNLFESDFAETGANGFNLS